jgi:hypothetical protein
MAAAQTVDIYAMTCEEVYKEKDYRSIELGIIELKKYEKELIKEPDLIKEYLTPLINNMKLGLQGKTKEITFTPQPKVKKFDQPVVNKAMGHYLTGQHELKDQQKQVKENVAKYGKTQDNSIVNAKKK